MKKLRMKEAYLDEQGVRISTVTGRPVRKYNKTSPKWVATEVAQQPEVVTDPVIAELQSLYTEDEIKGIINLKKDAAPVELIEIHGKTKSALDDYNNKANYSNANIHDKKAYKDADDALDHFLKLNTQANMKTYAEKGRAKTTKILLGIGATAYIVSNAYLFANGRR